MPEYLWSNGTVKLSWMGNVTERMDHNYTIVVYNVTRSNNISSPLYETVVVPFIFFDKCGKFDVQVKAVNRAGESEPSDNVRVSLPLLPDIQPVSDSLDHRVWKESSSQLMVQILFEVSDIYFTNGMQSITPSLLLMSSFHMHTASLLLCTTSNYKVLCSISPILAK